MAYTIIGGIGVVTTSHNMPNPCNIQTLNNVIMFCGDVEIGTSGYASGDVLLTLSDSEMAPATEVIIPVVVSTSNQFSIVPMRITTAGELKLGITATAGTIVHLNGICFNVNSKYYTPAIGNIYNNGTSPLSVL